MISFGDYLRRERWRRQDAAFEAYCDSLEPLTEAEIGARLAPFRAVCVWEIKERRLP